VGVFPEHSVGDSLLVIQFVHLNMQLSW